MISVYKKELEDDSPSENYSFSTNDIINGTDSVLPSSNSIDNLRSHFVKYYYYEPLRDDPDDIFKFFEECSIAIWAKNSPEHYLINQLQLNRNGNRVWDCSAAETVVIPISLGNWRRD